MFEFTKWVGRRLSCSVLGHRMEPSRFYYAPAKSVESGYACSRCGHTQLLLRRWQSVEAESE